MKTLLCLPLFVLALAPGCVLGQSLNVHNSVNAPIDLTTYQPLTGQQRFQRWVKEDGASLSIHIEAVTIAAINQATNSPAEWHRTTGGMERRLGSNYAQFLIGNSLHEGLAAAGGTDTRYFSCACGGLLGRAGHAIEMTFLTYNRQGRKVPDLPQFAGIYGGAMIGKLWYPHGYSPLVQGVQFGNIKFGIAGVIHLVQEFSPELKVAFHVRETKPMLAQ